MDALDKNSRTDAEDFNEGCSYMNQHILLSFLVFLILYCYQIRKLNYWKRRGVPYLKPVLFFGNLKEILLQKICIGSHLKNFYDKYKNEPYIGLFALDKPVLLVNDIEIVKDILQKHAHHFPDHNLGANEEADPLWAYMLFGLKGQQWRRMRTKMTPAFRSPIAVEELLARFMTDAVSTCALGIESNSLRDKNSTVRRQMRRVFDFSYKKGVKGILMFFTPDLYRFLRIKEQHGVIRRDLVDSLMELRNQDLQGIGADMIIDGDVLVAQILNVFLGGLETSSTTSTFILFELSQHPEIQDKARVDVLRVLENYTELTYEAINEMKYLDMVFLETLRRYPVLGFLDRICNKDFVIKDSSGKRKVTIEQGVSVYIPVLGIHMDPEFYPNPKKFDPERFSEENKKNIPNICFLPFGEGPRICIGKRLGQMQVKIAIAYNLVFNKDYNRAISVFESALTYTALLFFLVIVLFYFYVTRNFNYWKKLGVPYAKPIPFFGNLKDVFLLKDFIGCLLKIFYDKYKNEPYVGLFALDKPVLLLKDPEIIKDVLQKYSHHFPDHNMGSDEGADPLWGYMIFSLKGQQWKHLRNKLSPTFTSGKMKLMFNLVNGCAKQLVQVLDKAEEIDGDILVAQVLNIFLGGFETSSSALTFILYELSRHPEIQSKARDEIIQALKNNREICNKELVVEDSSKKHRLKIEKGVSVYIPIQAIHNDPSIYPNPERFDPERFSEENKKTRSNMYYLPFGDGPRVCIGKRFAQMTVKIAISYILSQFEISPCKDTPTTIVFDPKSFVLRPLQTVPLMLFGLSLLLLVVMVIAFYIKRTFSFWKVRGFPYLKGFYQLLSLDVFLLKTDPSHFFKNIYLNHKNFPYVGIYLFNAPKLIPTDLEIIKNVLVKDFQYFQSRNEVVDPNLDPLFSKSVIMISESKWRFVRNMITPSFTFGKIKAAFGHVDKCGQEMVQYLQRLTKDGSPCLLKDTMNRFTAQTIIGYIMGIEIDNFGESEPPMITYLKRGITLNVKQELTMVLMAAIPKLQQFLRLKKKNGIVRRDFLDNLMELKRKNEMENDSSTVQSFKFVDDDYAAQAFSFLTAGFETSSSTMSYTLYQMALNPDIQKRLSSEIKEVLKKNNNQITYDSIKEMKYLDMVVSGKLSNPLFLNC
ncbi:hypothetical protein C0J52_19684 [Blattella germanica]|nr:hypothetical protein C0J52_19684 [Blattella germanica]